MIVRGVYSTHAMGGGHDLGMFEVFVPQPSCWRPFGQLSLARYWN